MNRQNKKDKMKKNLLIIYSYIDDILCYMYFICRFEFFDYEYFRFRFHNTKISDLIL